MESTFGGVRRGSALPEVTHVGVLRPFHWLRAGWADVRSNPGPSLAHGAVLAALCWFVVLATGTHVHLIAAALSGLVLLAPVFAAAFYELSRLRESGQRATFDASLDGALRNGRSLVYLGALLALIALVWAGLSAQMFERVFGGQLPSIADSSWRSVFDWRYTGLVTAYVGTGAILAIVAFALAAVSVPAVFDRRLGNRVAILTSVKAVFVNPLAMGLWALLIAAGMMLAIATLFLGLVVMLPLFGHTTWHAYRDLLR